MLLVYPYHPLPAELNVERGKSCILQGNMNYHTKLCTISLLVLPWNHWGNWTSHPLSVSVLLFSLNLKGTPSTCKYFVPPLVFKSDEDAIVWWIFAGCRHYGSSTISPCSPLVSFPSFSLLHCGELHLLHNRPLSISRLSRLFLFSPPLFNLASFCELFSTSMRFSHQRAGQVERTPLTSLSVLGLTSFTSNWDNATQTKKKNKKRLHLFLQQWLIEQN